MKVGLYVEKMMQSEGASNEAALRERKHTRGCQCDGHFFFQPQGGVKKGADGKHVLYSLTLIGADGASV
jgi:hypothetical protein